ncbi:hypothetical protein ACLF3G_28350 [Falsiroseomonas sp. HC035]|uniref:hypothetical protein n=1 Tax=Falsiroseomonas sp. HC035 TaxID=3390999 RepID=UPI003D31D9C8
MAPSHLTLDEDALHRLVLGVMTRCPPAAQPGYEVLCASATAASSGQQREEFR